MPNTVTYSVTQTMNLGNYESIKVEIGETREVDTVIADSQEVYDDIREVVNARLSRFVKGIREKQNNA